MIWLDLVGSAEAVLLAGGPVAEPAAEFLKLDGSQVFFGRVAMRILHFADLHFGQHPGPSGEGSRLRDLEQMLDFIGMEAVNVDLVVIPGDIFDVPRPDFEQIISFVRRLREMTAHTPVAIIPGNHDKAVGQEGVWHLIKEMKIPGAWVFTRPEAALCDTNGGQVQIVALPYEKPDLLRDEEMAGRSMQEIAGILGRRVLARLKTLMAERDPSLPTVILGHLDVAGAVRSSGQKVLPGTDPVVAVEELEGLGADYVALGHIHRAQRLSARVFYSGSPERMDFGEREEKGFWIADIAPGEVPAVEFRSTPARRFVVLEAELKKVEDLSPWYESLGLLDLRGAYVLVAYLASEEVAKAVNDREIRRQVMAAGAHYLAGIQGNVERVARVRDKEVTEAMSVLEALKRYTELNKIANDRLLPLAVELLEEMRSGI